ncbi:S1 family peptidase [Saccharothrix algeriensis]|uniref:Trypsin-like serine protease n=1 Tax=Saccharothrix algeriensis TaxID=173560 RepID=A0A8T8HY49_9PSEU|nr:S1 family peptidase [Saccharothrix algeriensis]MBM7815090.1 hypothetical protein [Saccharothrix algeriensis]QTR03341.1 trypsin-like serine protease [Saccharothrix algeriensis]
MLAALAVIGPGTASAAPGGGSGIGPDEGAGPSSAAVQARMLAQRPYVDAASRIEGAAHDAAGFAGVAVRDDRVVVWWKGDPPARVAEEVGRSRVRVEVRPAAHSWAELRVAADRVAARMKADPASPVHMVRVPVDGSRVVALVDRDVTDVSPAESGVPVEVVRHQRLHPAAGPATRYNDGWNGDAHGPFAGGGAIVNRENGTRCTAGFGVRDGSGARFLLTAGHCGRVGRGWDNGNRSRFIGDARAEHAAHDLLLVAANSSDRMWDGGATANSFTKRVSGWDRAVAGAMVCQSGSTSGALCGVRNSDDFVHSYCDTDAYGNYECYSDLVYAYAEDRTRTVCRGGDSGGPVFTPAGTGVVRAVGTLSGCGGWALLYQDFHTATRDLGITTG